MSGRIFQNVVLQLKENLTRLLAGIKRLNDLLRFLEEERKTTLL